jgi:glutamate-1-semialdehyde 2,1-aminomutase
MLAEGINEVLARMDLPATLVRQGSAFCLYFMDHAPSDWHDIAANNDGVADEATRQGLIERGIYVFPLATKQCSLSSAHTESDVEFTIGQFDAVLSGMRLSGAHSLP